MAQLALGRIACALAAWSKLHICIAPQHMFLAWAGHGVRAKECRRAAAPGAAEALLTLA